MYDDLDPVAGRDDKWNELQLVRAEQFQFDVAEPDGIGEWCVHSDSGERC